MVSIIQIIKVDKVNIVDTPHKVAVKKLLSYEHASLVHIELKPGESLKKHITPVDVAFYVLEGEGIVEIGKEIEKVKQDQLIFSPAKVPHLLKNESGENFRFLVVKTPTPTSQTQIL